ncbi:hypothetical protein LINPERHAP1_LOCUS19776, partial [Linum perenne]
MMLLLRQKQRIILAESDVTGWGAFLKVYFFTYSTMLRGPVIGARCSELVVNVYNFRIPSIKMTS